MAETEKRKAFIIFILDEILNYMGLSIEQAKGNEIKLTYLHSESTTFIYIVTFDKLLGFCGIKDLAYRYMWMVETDFFSKITECKFFNYNMFKSAKQRKRIYHEAKQEELQGMCRMFLAYIVNNTEEMERKKYKFTKHENMHIKAIDNFFGFNIEKTLIDNYKALKSAKISPEKVRSYIAEASGISDKTISNKIVQEVIQELKESAEYRRDGFQGYLEKSNDKTIKEDIQIIFKYYIKYQIRDNK